ncbi:MAG: histidine phosphatase family protein [Hornefia sp.]|nr:histidine phosphatase family protein [Hornefia sp.]
MKTKIFLVRHGETNWNKARKFQGMTDIPLNEAGKIQAGYAHEALKAFHIDVAFASPLCRAQETARIILEGRDIELNTEEELHEQNAGDWEGLTAAEIEEKFPGQHDLWTSRPTRVHIQNGESFQQVQERAVKAFWKLVKENDGKTILIVAHMVCLSMILLKIAGISIDEIWDRPLSNASYSIVNADPKTMEAEIVDWNHDEHIPEEQRRKPRVKEWIKG